MNNSKTLYTHTEAENPRFDSVSNMFEPANAGDWGKGGIESIQHIRTPVTKTYYSEEIAIGLSKSDDYTMNRVRALLDASGVNMEAATIKSYGSHSYINIPKASADDMIKVVIALGNDVENPHGAAHYAVLSPEIVNGIADIAAEKMSISPLISITSIEMDTSRAAAFGVDDAPDHYTDIDMRNYGASPVRFIRDDSRYIDRAGQPVFERSSTLSVDTARIPQLKAAFTEAKMDHGIIADGLLAVHASSHDVVRTLSSHALIPQHFARTLEV